MNVLEPYRADLVRMKNNPNVPPGMIAVKERQLQSLENAMAALRDRCDNAALVQGKKYRRYIEHLESDAESLRMHNAKLIEMYCTCLKIMAAFDIRMDRAERAFLDPMLADALLAVKKTTTCPGHEWHRYQVRQWDLADINRDATRTQFDEKDIDKQPQIKQFIQHQINETRRVSCEIITRSGDVLLKIFQKFPTLKNLLTNE